MHLTGWYTMGLQQLSGVTQTCHTKQEGRVSDQGVRGGFHKKSLHLST